MKIIKNFSNVSNGYKKCVLTIGVFDGLHLGHQNIIKQVTKKACKLKKKSIVVTFDPHPVKTLNFFKGKNTEEGFLITTLEERLQLIKDTDADCVVIIKFTRDFLNVSPEKFICKIVRSFNPKCIVTGPNHTFGKDGKGNPFLLKIFGKMYGFKTVILKPKKLGSEFITSTTIRKAIKRGDVKKASSMLGRCFFINGRVVHGSKRGLSLGFPTANVKTPEDKLIPKSGVYVAFTRIGSRTYRSLVNIGFRPTFREKTSKRRIEVFIMNFKGNLYGRNLHIDFVSKLRDEIKFPNKSALINQIKKDLNKAANLFRNLNLKGGL